MHVAHCFRTEAPVPPTGEPDIKTNAKQNDKTNKATYIAGSSDSSDDELDKMDKMIVQTQPDLHPKAAAKPPPMLAAEDLAEALQIAEAATTS